VTRSGGLLNRNPGDPRHWGWILPGFLVAVVFRRLMGPGLKLNHAAKQYRRHRGFLSAGADVNAVDDG